MSQVLLWLNELTHEYRKRGQLQEAISCVTKAMYHFGNDKGELQAQVGGPCCGFLGTREG